MPVVDASVLVEFLRGGEHREMADEQLLAEEHTLWAPYLIDAEVGHALRRAVRRREIGADVAGASIWEINRLPVERVEHELLVHVAWDLRDNFSFYEGLYVALALVLDEPLITFDARLARSGIDLPIEVLAQA